MAAAFGGATRIASFSAASSASGAAPTVSGPNTCGTVDTTVDNGVAITSVTWHGVAMTEIAGAKIVDGSRTMQSWELAGVPAGASTVVITASGNWSNMFAGVRYSTGIDQSNPIDAATTGSAGVGNTLSNAIVTTSDGALVLDQAMQKGAGATLSATSPSTRDTNGNNTNFSWGVSHAAGPTPAGSKTMAWSSTSSSFSWDWSAYALKPAATGGVLESQNMSGNMQEFTGGFGG